MMRGGLQLPPSSGAPSPPPSLASSASAASRASARSLSSSSSPVPLPPLSPGARFSIIDREVPVSAFPPLPFSRAYHLVTLTLHAALLVLLIALSVWPSPVGVTQWRPQIVLLIVQVLVVATSSVLAFLVSPYRGAPVSYRTGRVIYVIFAAANLSGAATWGAIGVVGWVLLLGYDSTGRFTTSGLWWLRRRGVAVTMGAGGLSTAAVTAWDVWSCAWLMPCKTQIVQVGVGELGACDGPAPSLGDALSVEIVSSMGDAASERSAPSVEHGAPPVIVRPRSASGGGGLALTAPASTDGSPTAGGDAATRAGPSSRDACSVRRVSSVGEAALVHAPSPVADAVSTRGASAAMCDAASVDGVDGGACTSYVGAAAAAERSSAAAAGRP